MTEQQSPWTPFGRAQIDTSDFNTEEAWARYRALADADPDPSHSAEFYHQTYLTLANDEHYINSRYQVAVRRTMVDDGAGGESEMVHLSVKRLDKGVVRDWRDMQRIKNELLGVECEAVELYPAESRCVDTANQYHLWGVRDPNFRWPVGWNEGQVKLDNNDYNTEVIGAAQRPFEPSEELLPEVPAVMVRDYGAMWASLKSVITEQGHASISAGAVLSAMESMEKQ